MRYQCVGERGFCLGAGKTRSEKMPQNPTRQMHALLGCFFAEDSMAKKRGFLLERRDYGILLNL